MCPKCSKQLIECLKQFKKRIQKQSNFKAVIATI